MSGENDRDGESRFRRPPTGPSVVPPRPLIDQPAAAPVRVFRYRRSYWSVAIFVLLISGIGIQAYRDLSGPDAWDYWKDQYVSPSLTASVIAKLDLDGAAGGRRALFVSGTIGPAAANWFRGKLDEAHLTAGDMILLSSPGGDLNQAAIIGEIIRSRGLATAVGIADAAGRVKPSYCASACVLVFAGGKPRFGMLGSASTAL